MNRYIVNGDTRIEVGDKTITIEELPQDSLPGQNPKLRHWKRNLARGAAPETEFLAFRAASLTHDREYRYLVSKELLGLDSNTWRAGECALERAKELFRQSLPGRIDEKDHCLIPDGEYDIAWERGLFASADFALYYGERPSRL